MKRFHNILTPLITTALVMLIGFTGLAGVSGTAYATAPSHSPLSITVTVSHSAGEVTIPPVFFEVILRPSSPLLSSPADQFLLLGDEIIYSYTATATANGPDTYNLSIGGADFTNVDGAPTASLSQGGVAVASLTLGVTAASGFVEAGNVEVPVPSDGDADGSVNGIEAGDKVVIHGASHVVASVADDGSSAAIVLAEAHDSDIGVGDLIFEQADFELVITGIEIADSENDATAAITVTATSAADPGISGFDDSLTTVYSPIPASSEHYVRNVSNPNAVGDVAYTATFGEQYYGTEGEILADAEDVLEYIIIQKAGNTGDLENVVITSTLPLFTTYVPNSTILHDGNPDNNPLPDNVTFDPPRSLLVGGLNVNSPGMPPATIARFGLAEVTFQVIVDAIPESAPPPGGEQEQGPAQGQQEGQQKVAWAPNQGDPACWDAAYAQTDQAGIGWIDGQCAGGTLAGRPWGQEQCDGLAEAHVNADQWFQYDGLTIWTNENGATQGGISQRVFLHDAGTGGQFSYPEDINRCL